jgi:hypothetical protein
LRSLVQDLWGGVVDLRELPRNVIFRAEALTAFLQRREVTRGHHTGAIPRGAWNGQRARDLLVSATNDVEVVLRTFERRRIS